MVRAGADAGQRVLAFVDLDLVPDLRHGRGDDRVLLVLQQLRDLLGELRRLVLNQNQLGPRLRDL